MHFLYFFFYFVTFYVFGLVLYEFGMCQMTLGKKDEIE